MGQMINRRDAWPAAATGASRARVPAAAGTAILPAADQRADGRQRTVVLSRDCVRIDRRLAGIAMRVAVPVRSYRGVALSLLPDAAGALHYQVSLVHRDADLSVALDCAGDDADILADWRSWSRFFGLPALVERRPGQMEDAEPTLGGLAVGRMPAQRRRRLSRSRRRPRFLARRKPGDATLLAIAHTGEREIVART